MVRRLVRVTFALVLVAGLAYALVSQRGALIRDARQIGAATFGLALVCVLVGLAASLLSWRAVLASLGAPLPVLTAARIFYVGQLGKYLPGSVWPLVTQMQLGRGAGVPRSRMGLAGVVALGLSVATGLMVGLLSLPVLVRGRGEAYAVLSVLALVLALALVHPAVLNALLATGLRLARREPLDQPLTVREMATPVGFLLLFWATMGVQTWLLVRAVGAGGGAGRGLVVSVGAYALAMTLGLLFVLAPAGAGVREVVLVLGLAPVLSTSGATAVALSSRLLVTVADALMAGAALLVDRTGGRGLVREGDG